MHISFSTPEFIQEARSKGKGHQLWLEILIFIAVFLVGSVLQSIPSIVELLIRIFSNSTYLSIIASGNAEFIENILLPSDITTIISLVSTALMIITVIIFCRFIEKRSLRTMGFIKRGFLKEYALGLLIGAVMFSAAVLLCAAAGTLHIKGISPSFMPDILLIFLLSYMIQGMSEEVMCRGYFMVSVSRKSALSTAVIVNSLVFACLHLLNPGISILAFINLVLFGTFASVYMLRQGSIWGAAAIHSAWNFVQGNLFGISVSGTGETTSLLSSTLSSKGTLINGGAFGLEGGLAVTLVLAVGIAAVLLMPIKIKD